MQVFADLLLKKKDKIENRRRYLAGANPERNLKLGYSIVRNKAGKVVRFCKDVKVGESIITKLFQGELDSRVEKIKNSP